MELLVVIAIVAILSTAVMFSIRQVRARARDSVRLADIDTFTKGLDLYLNSEGSYPISASEICIDGTDTVSAELDANGVLSKSVKDPTFVGSPNCFRYVSDAGGTSYTVRFYLETNSLGKKGYNYRP